MQLTYIYVAHVFYIAEINSFIHFNSVLSCNMSFGNFHPQTLKRHWCSIHYVNCFSVFKFTMLNKFRWMKKKTIIWVVMLCLKVAYFNVFFVSRYLRFYVLSHLKVLSVFNELILLFRYFRHVKFKRSN